MWLIAQADGSNYSLKAKLDSRGLFTKKERGRLLVMLETHPDYPATTQETNFALPPELNECAATDLKLFLCERNGQHKQTHCPYGVVIADRNGKALHWEEFPFIKQIDHLPGRAYFTHPSLTSIWAIAKDMDRTFTLAGFRHRVTKEEGRIVVSRSIWFHYQPDDFRVRGIGKPLSDAITAAKIKAQCHNCQHTHYAQGS